MKAGGVREREREGGGRERCLDGSQREKSAIESFLKPLFNSQLMTSEDSEEAGLLWRGHKKKTTLQALVWLEVAVRCLPTAKPVIPLGFLSYVEIFL